MTLQFSALPRERFENFFSMDDAALAAIGARRSIADHKPGFPCRVSLADAEPGERVILLSFQHQAADSPYRASGPIYVREQATDRMLAPGEVPDFLRARLLSVRSYDAHDLLVASDVVEGREVESALLRLFEDPMARYAHVHLARPGCYVCRVDLA